MKKIKDILIMIIIISFIGFCFEDLWMVFRYSLLDNRNMFLPFLFGYGLFIIVLYYVFGTPKKIFNKYEFCKPINYIIYIIICFIGVSIGELSLGIIIEKIFNFNYWDYSSIPLHFTRYTSVPTSLGFSLIITFFMNYLYIPLQNKIKNISKRIPTFLVIIVFLALIIDMSISYYNMVNNGGRNVIWMINLK